MTNRIQKEEKISLLKSFREICLQGQAEDESPDENVFLKRFLPIRSHFRVLDPLVRLIIGDKGSGKTHLFQALELENGRKVLTDLAKAKGETITPLEKSQWIIGFKTSGMDFPPAAVIKKYAREHDSSMLQNFWLYLIARMLYKKRKIDSSSLSESLNRALTATDWNLERILTSIDSELGLVFQRIDNIDTNLDIEDAFIFISYDELDRVSPGDWGAMKSILQGLVQFWAAYSRRWRRIRPKIFLRRDLYQRAALMGPDIAKIASNRAELLWDIHEFYGVVFKRLLNNDEFRDYLAPARIPLIHDPDLGYTPQAKKEKDYETAIDRMFGKHMGTDPRKGLTLRWLPNHLKDGHGRIYPRPLLRLLEDAAEIELRDRRALGLVQLFHHSALRGAL
ncbi:MAG: hypothetical protein AB1798_19610, partial [Spirochaetota bacterium]